ncbi:MAG: hypothetical protein AB7E79_15305 [Rhodospirillaceae bacterium]
MVGLLSSIPISVTGSALFGTAGSAGASVLGAFNSDGTSALLGDISSTTTSLINQMKATANQRLVDQQTAIEEVATQKREAINVQNERWIAVKAQVNNAQIAVDNGRDSIAKINETLLLMRGSVAGTEEDLDFYKDLFNTQVTQINNEADSGGKAFNLIGSINRLDYTPNQIEYRNDLGVGFTQLTGTYAGSDWRIEANDGTVWIPDLGSDLIEAYSALGGEAQKYTTGGIEIRKATSTRNGLELVSYNSQTNAITVKISIVPHEAPITVTGTLKRHGNGLMQAWFYNDFATDADRTRAFKDITAAEVNITLASGALERSVAQTTIDQRKVDRALDELTKQSGAVQLEQMEQMQEVRMKAAQQYQAMLTNLQNLSAQQSNYLNAFAGFIDSPFAQASLNLLA